MKKLLYIPFAINVVLLLYVAVFILYQMYGPSSSFRMITLKTFDRQYVSLVQLIVLLPSFAVPFFRTRVWLRIATPMSAIAHWVLVFAFWTHFTYG